MIITGRRPAGVTAVAALTFMGTISLGLFSLFLILVRAVGGPGPVAGAGSLPLSVAFPGFLAVFGLILAVGQLMGAKWVWFASMAFWIMVFTYFCWFAYMIGHGIVWLDQGNYFTVGYGFQGLLASLVPLIYGAGCITYFLTKSPREYFKV